MTAECDLTVPSARGAILRMLDVPNEIPEPDREALEERARRLKSAHTLWKHEECVKLAWQYLQRARAIDAQVLAERPAAPIAPPPPPAPIAIVKATSPEPEPLPTIPTLAEMLLSNPGWQPENTA